MLPLSEPKLCFLHRNQPAFEHHKYEPSRQGISWQSQACIKCSLSDSFSQPSTAWESIPLDTPWVCSCGFATAQCVLHATCGILPCCCPTCNPKTGNIWVSCWGPKRQRKRDRLCRRARGTSSPAALESCAGLFCVNPGARHRTAFLEAEGDSIFPHTLFATDRTDGTRR